MDIPPRRPATPAEAKALAHPLRQRIVRLCGIREHTNKQLADRLDRDPATVLHHVRQLVAAGFLEPGQERALPSGAVEKPYRSTGRSWTVEVGVDGTPRAEAAMLEATRAELAEAGAGSVLRSIRIAIRLPEEEVLALGDRIQELIEEAHRRAAPLDDPTVPAVGGLFLLHRFPDPVDVVDDATTGEAAEV